MGIRQSLANLLSKADKYSGMRIMVFAVVLGAVVAGVLAEDVAARSAPADRVLMIERSFTKVPGGKATLIIGPLRRTNDIFGGQFEMKVVPYFFKNDKGTLSIVITPECFEKASKGLTVDITGTATTAGKNGIVRPINAVATPMDNDHGALKLWFVVDDRKMVFETKYRFAD
jgi:hypothetical protein